MDPEFPNCALAGPAAKNSINPKTKTTLILKCFIIFLHPFESLCAFSVDRARRINGGGTGLQIGQRMQIHFESGSRTRRGEVRVRRDAGKRNCLAPRAAAAQNTR